MIKTIIAPLLFGTLVVGIAGHPNLRHVGRMGLKALVYFEVVTTLALFIGLAAINLTQAGVGVLPPEGLQPAGVTGVKQTISDVVLSAFPENVAKAVAEGHVLQVVVFSILFAVALSLLPEARRRPMLSFAESLSETMFKFTNLVMLFAPVGVGAAIAYTVGHMGLGILVNLAKLLGTLYLALTAFLLFVLLPGGAPREGAHPEVRRGDRGARLHRVRHHELGGRAAPGHGAHGGVRGAAADRGLRHADGLQLQPRRLDALPGPGVGVRRPGRRHPPVARPSSSLSCSR